MKIQQPQSIPETMTRQPPLFDATEPGQLHVIKRDGRVTKYDADRIKGAMKKTFLAVEGDNATNSDRIQEIVEKLTDQITTLFHQRWPSGGTIHIEAIQDKVELALMYAGLHKVARAYVLYREERRKQREDLAQKENVQSKLHITLQDGKKVPLDQKWLADLILAACKNTTDVDFTKMLEDTQNNLFDGVALKDVYKALVMTARTHIENEPNYTYVAARLLLHDVYEEALSGLHIQHDLMQDSIKQHYPTAFREFIQQGIEHEHLNKNLRDFNLDQLAAALRPERDQQFTYLSLQTLYDRYFIHHEHTRIEMPQVFFMRVAMGLAHCENKQRNERAIEFYHLLSSFDFMSSTPTLFNSGTAFPQLSSCFLTTVPDSLSGIYSALKDNALLSKYAGGLGNDWTPVRGMGAYIKGTNGKSLGVVPFLNVSDATAIP